MSEPTLLQTFTEIRLDIAEELGFTRVEGKWSASKVTKVDNFFNAGYRRFLFSAQLPNESQPHTWSFLEPVAQIVVWPTITGTSVGVPTYDASTYSTITASATKFYPTMVGKSFTFDTSGNSYTVSSYTSGTVIKVLGDASAEASGDTFTVTADGDYRLPDDFGGMIGTLHVTGNSTAIISTTHVGVAVILNKRANISTYNFTPYNYALGAVKGDGTAGQRFNLMLYPTPNEVTTFDYQYRVLPDKLSTSATFPAGAEQFSEAIRYSCLAEVERRHQIDRGFRGEYERLLYTAIQRDRLDNMPDYLGYNGNEPTGGDRWPYSRSVGASITFNGSEI